MWTGDGLWVAHLSGGEGGVRGGKRGVLHGKVDPWPGDWGPP